jgi:hypothetical protein
LALHSMEMQQHAKHANASQLRLLNQVEQVRIGDRLDCESRLVVMRVRRS